MVNPKITDLENAVAQEHQEIAKVLDELRHQRIGLIASHLMSVSPQSNAGSLGIPVGVSAAVLATAHPKLIAGLITIAKQFSGVPFVNSGPTSTTPSLTTH